jgi:predicted nuclease of predicted toxin-antitoxin system
VKFKIDENLPAELAEDLHRLGQSADTVEGEGIVGAADSIVVSAALADRRIILTLDKGIANVVRFPTQTHAGIVLFRPGSLGRRAVLKFIRDRLDPLLRLDLAERVTVVTDERIRMR